MNEDRRDIDIIQVQHVYQVGSDNKMARSGSNLNGAQRTANLRGRARFSLSKLVALTATGVGVVMACQDQTLQGVVGRKLRGTTRRAQGWWSGEDGSVP